MGSSLIQAKEWPWLALPSNPNQGKRFLMRFESVSSNKVFHCGLPIDASGKTIIGSSAAFLIMANETLEITLIDPLTKARFQLPPLPTSMASEYSTDIDSGNSTRENQNYLLRKAVLSSPPDCNPYDYILMVIYGEKRELAYYGARAQNWIKVKEAGHYYDDIICYMGVFYAVDEYGKVVLCQPGFPPAIQELAKPWLLRGSKIYLVGVDDELWVVIRYLKDDPTMGYETYNFDVHLLKSKYERRQIGTFEEWALFLGQNESVALPIEDFEGLKGSCVYFTDDNLEACKYGVNGGHDLGVFDSEEMSFHPLQCFQDGLRFAWPRPVWLAPKEPFSRMLQQ